MNIAYLQVTGRPIVVVGTRKIICRYSSSWCNWRKTIRHSCGQICSRNHLRP